MYTCFSNKIFGSNKTHPNGGKRIQGDQFEAQFNKLIN
jgi:hypothetical protein